MQNFYENKLDALDVSLDKIALQKRLQIEAEHLKRIKCIKIIRFYAVLENNELKVYTRVLNDYSGELNVDHTNLWEIIRRICITIEEKGEKARICEWAEKDEAEAFKIKNVTKEMKIKLFIKFTNQRQLFKLEEKLAALISTKYESKPNIVKELYKYISQRKLLNHTNGYVQCDDALKEVFQVESFDFNTITDLIELQLKPVGYCKISLDFLKTEKSLVTDENTLIYDLEVECDDTTQMPILFSNEVKMLAKKIEGNKILKKKLEAKMTDLEEFIENPRSMISRSLILEKDILGIKTKFYEDLGVQSTLFELLMNYKEK